MAAHRPRKSLTLIVLLAGLTLVGFGSSATSAIPGCKLVSYTVGVNFDDTRHHKIIDHAFDARRAGHPRTLRIARHEPKGRSAGRLMGERLRPFCDGQRFYFER